jgi:hypothetical protein
MSKVVRYLKKRKIKLSMFKKNHDSKAPFRMRKLNNLKKSNFTYNILT